MVYFGGDFTQVNASLRTFLAAMDAGGALQPWNPATNAQVNALGINAGTVYAGGLFGNFVTGVPYYLCAINGATTAFTAWTPAPAGLVRSLAVAGSTVYAGGPSTWSRSSRRATSWRSRIRIRSGWVIGRSRCPRGVELRIGPNPLSGRSTIRFRLPRAAEVTLRLFDLQGREVRGLLDRARLAAGDHGVGLGAVGLESGIYFCDLEAGALRARARVVVIH